MFNDNSSRAYEKVTIRSVSRNPHSGSNINLCRSVGNQGVIIVFGILVGDNSKRILEKKSEKSTDYFFFFHFF